MTINEIKQKINYAKEYDFLQENEHLGSNIILLGLGGSYAYGTNTETSDLDIRGVATKRKHEILTPQNFEQFINEETDTTIYSFDKICSLLLNCNPNVIELLGLKPEHYLYLNDVGQMLLDNSDLFLSRKVVGSFKGYANQQLYRLLQATTGLKNQNELEEHILNTLNNMMEHFGERYAYFPENGINLYIDKSDREDMSTEIFMDINLTHYPVRDYKSMWSEMNTTVKSYSNIGKRNKHAIDHGKLGKHMCHLIRLYLMCLDILNEGKIVTYREKEHDLLMDLRNGKYLDENGMPTKEFFEINDNLADQVEIAAMKTSIPKEPNYKGIYRMMADVNEMIVKGD